MLVIEYLKDFEASNIQYTDEVLSLLFRVQSLVDTGHQPLEYSVVHSLRQGSHGIDHLLIRPSEKSVKTPPMFALWQCQSQACLKEEGNTNHLRYGTVSLNIKTQSQSIYSTKHSSFLTICNICCCYSLFKTMFHLGYQSQRCNNYNEHLKRWNELSSFNWLNWFLIWTISLHDVSKGVIDENKLYYWDRCS